MKDIEREKLETRKKEILKKNEELNEQFTKVNNWITQARSEYAANLGRIDELDKFIAAIIAKDDEVGNKRKSK